MNLLDRCGWEKNGGTKLLGKYVNFCYWSWVVYNNLSFGGLVALHLFNIATVCILVFIVISLYHSISSCGSMISMITNVDEWYLFTGTKDPLGKRLNNSKTRAEIGWEPKYPSFGQFLETI